MREIATIRNRLAAGAKYADIATELGRSYTSVRNAAYRYELSPHIGPGRPVGMRHTRETREKVRVAMVRYYNRKKRQRRADRSQQRSTQR
jgi:hypothetical protein